MIHYQVFDDLSKFMVSLLHTGTNLRELIFVRINFRTFREFWPISQKFLPRKIKNRSIRKN